MVKSKVTLPFLLLGGLILASALLPATDAFACTCSPSSCSSSCTCTDCVNSSPTIHTIPATLYPDVNCTGTPTIVYSLPYTNSGATQHQLPNSATIAGSVLQTSTISGTCANGGCDVCGYCGGPVSSCAYPYGCSGDSCVCVAGTDVCGYCGGPVSSCAYPYGCSGDSCVCVAGTDACNVCGGPVSSCAYPYGCSGDSCVCVAGTDACNVCGGTVTSCSGTCSGDTCCTINYSQTGSCSNWGGVYGTDLMGTDSCSNTVTLQTCPVVVNVSGHTGGLCTYDVDASKNECITSYYSGWCGYNIAGLCDTSGDCVGGNCSCDASNIYSCSGVRGTCSAACVASGSCLIAILFGLNC